MLDPFEGALDRRAVDVEALGQLAERRLGRLAPGIGDEPDDGRLSREPAVGVELLDSRDLGVGGADRPVEVRRLSVEDLAEVAAQRPGDLMASSSSRAAPAPIRRRNRPTVSALFQADDAPPPVASRHAAGSPSCSRCAARTGASAGGTTNSRCVRPLARLERAAGEEQAAEVGHPAVLGRGVPVERSGGRTSSAVTPSAARPLPAPAAPPAARPDPRGRVVPTRAHASPGGRRAVRGRSRPAQSGGPRRGRVPDGSRLGRHATAGRAGLRGCGPRPTAAGYRPRARRGGSAPRRAWPVVMAVRRVDDVIEHELGAGVNDGGQRRRTDSAG